MSHHEEKRKDAAEENGKVYSTLAVKYRPKLLKDVVGQDGAVNIIRGIMKTRKIPRTILIHGPFGAGKTTLAKLIMRYVNCEHKGGPDECDGCDSCKAWRKDRHPDVHEKDAGTFRGIDDVREIQKVAGFMPRYERRGYIMDECHALTKDAWNASLKVFEEPPGKSMFLMCTTELQKIPETIQSRSLLLKLFPIDEETLLKLVRKIAAKEGKEDFPKDAAKMIAQAAMGHPRNAISLLEQILLYLESGELKMKHLEKQMPEIVRTVLGLPPEQTAIRYFSAIMEKDYKAAFSILPEVMNAPVFMSMFTKLLCQHIYSLTAHKVMDGRYTRIVGHNEKALKKYWSERRLGEMLDLSLKTFERMKMYVVPERECLDLFTMSAIQLAR